MWGDIVKTKEKCSVINKLLMGKNEILFNLFYLIADDKNALFISRNKRRLSNKTVQHIVYTFLEKAGFGNMGFSTHKLRHTAATLMYQKGNVDIRALKEVLGHAIGNNFNAAIAVLDKGFCENIEKYLQQSIDGGDKL